MFFYETVQSDLSVFKNESDQGKGLISCCKAHNWEHIFCLRLFWANLQKLKFGFEASKFVSCRCKKDFETLTKEFNKTFLKLNDKDIKILNQTLRKIGMSFINEEITIVNREMWKQVSMIKKRSYRMPITTNSIESIHGHLNEATPRNNCFWPSLHRIIMAINFQIHRFNDKLHHNYNKIVRDIKRKIHL